MKKKQNQPQASASTAPTPVIPIEALQFNEHNPRAITQDRLDYLTESLKYYGDIGGIIFNRRTGRLVGGHQRIKAFMQSGDAARVVIDRTLDQPDATGTVAYGHVECNGTRYSYREVDWDEMREKGAMLAVNKAAGDFVEEKVHEILNELNNAKFNLNLTGFNHEEINEIIENSIKTPYTPKIISPVYKPTTKTIPPIASLYNTEKRDKLLKSIEESDCSEDVKVFLREAANRHVVFNYQMIAEYYAHSAPNIQRLFEESGLVIIDFNKAIEYGFVRLTKILEKLYDMSQKENKNNNDAKE